MNKISIRKVVAYAAPIMFALVAMAPSKSLADEWRLHKLTGVVRVQAPDAKAPIIATENSLVAAGATIITGADSAVEVGNGKSTLKVGANTRMSIAPMSTDVFTKILQPLGSVFYQVDKRPEHHFSVQTPYLAAVVKGTQFSVDSGGARDVVRVRSGIVDVEPRNGAAPKDVTAGGYISVGAKSGDVSLIPLKRADEETNLPSVGDVKLEAPKIEIKKPDAAKLDPIQLPFAANGEQFKKLAWLAVLSFVAVVGGVTGFQILRARARARAKGAEGDWRAYSEIEKSGAESVVLIIVHDREGKAIDGAKIAGHLTPSSGSGARITLRFGGTGKGMYQAGAGLVLSGSYRLRATVSKDGQSLSIERVHTL